MKEYIAGGEQSICKLLFTEARGGSADEFLRAETMPFTLNIQLGTLEHMEQAVSMLSARVRFQKKHKGIHTHLLYLRLYILIWKI